MTSTRPYLIRAFYEWIADNNCTPYIVVNAHHEGVDVPMEYAQSGQIVLNIAMVAVQSLQLGDASIDFQARFAGIARHVHVPIAAVMAIYARENGRGMVFSEEDDEPPPSKFETEDDERGEESEGKKSSGGKKSNGSHLTVVK